MGAPALHWAIAKSRVPHTLKKTLYTLALVADAEQGFANIYLSKRQIGEFSGKGERQAREDMSDLVRFGVLTIVEASRGRESSRYQLQLERLAAWSDADTLELAAFRRRRRPDGKAKTRAKGEGQPGSADPLNPDRPIRSTRIGRSEDQYKRSLQVMVRSPNAESGLCTLWITRPRPARFRLAAFPARTVTIRCSSTIRAQPDTDSAVNRPRIMRRRRLAHPWAITS